MQNSNTPKTKFESQEILVKKDDAKLRLEAFLKKYLSKFPYGLIHKSIRKGYIKVNGKKQKYDYITNTGDIIFIKNNLHIAKKQNITAHQKYIDDFKSWICFEDPNIIVIEKPQKISVQRGTKVSLSIDDILKTLNQQTDDPDQKLLLVHRIDKMTSGLLLIAKGKSNANKIMHGFKEKKIKKEYLAVTKGNIKNNKGTIKSMITDKSGNKKEAITEYKLLSKNNGYNLLSLNPKTGRKHQIRIHLSHNLHTYIVGDLKYGKRKDFTDLKRETIETMHLLAYSIDISSIFHKTNKIYANVPNHITNICKHLGLSLPIRPSIT